MASVIAEMINDVTASNPDDFAVAIQRKLTSFVTSKEAYWKDEIDKVCMIFIQV